MAANVSLILDRKGADVVTVPADATLLEAARVLSERNIGALVVSGDGQAVDGIVSERDLVRHCASAGPSCWDESVRGVMTIDVTTCGMDATVDELMVTMTERRIRHVVAVADGRLAGIVSIGDVVKARLDDLEVQAESLERYVTGS